jgi:formylglycine-generating enzyme required for sulfatase activity
VEQVSWEDAQEFIQKVNEQEQGRSGWVCRLPTEKSGNMLVGARPVPGKNALSISTSIGALQRIR